MWSGFLEHPLYWCVGVFLGAVWLSRLLAAALNMHKLAEIARPDYDAAPVDASGRGRSSAPFGKTDHLRPHAAAVGAAPGPARLGVHRYVRLWRVLADGF